MTEKAEEGAIKVFGKEPGTASDAASYRGTGGFADPGFPVPAASWRWWTARERCWIRWSFTTAPQNKVEESRKILKDFIKKYNISLSRVGQRHSIQGIRADYCGFKKEIRNRSSTYFKRVQETRYSASKLATEEFPALTWARGARYPLPDVPGPGCPSW